MANNNRFLRVVKMDDKQKISILKGIIQGYEEAQFLASLKDKVKLAADDTATIELLNYELDTLLSKQGD